MLWGPTGRDPKGPSHPDRLGNTCPRPVIPGYTRKVKTAISVPDQTYDRAERVAKKHGMNRSQFYSAAADRYAAELESADTTAAIDAAVDAANADTSSRFAVAAGARILDGADEEW